MRDRISSLIPDPDVSIVSTSNNCLSVVCICFTFYYNNFFNLSHNSLLTQQVNHTFYCTLDISPIIIIIEIFLNHYSEYKASMYHNQPVKGLYPSQASFYTCSRLILVIHVYILQGYSYRLISLIQKSYYNSVLIFIKPRIALPHEGGVECPSSISSSTI